jgi:hypothetical protein
MKAPFLSLRACEASDPRCRANQKSRPQGLATLSTTSAASTPESLFQLPTLRGFALQSFPPLR